MADNAGKLKYDTADVLHGILRPRDPEDAKIQSMTKREREIILLVGQGLKNAAIGQRLFISEATVRNHLTSIMSKLEVSDKFELVVYSFHHGLITTKAREPSPERSGNPNAVDFVQRRDEPADAPAPDESPTKAGKISTSSPDAGSAVRALDLTQTDESIIWEAAEASWKGVSQKLIGLFDSLRRLEERLGGGAHGVR